MLRKGQKALAEDAVRPEEEIKDTGDSLETLGLETLAMSRMSMLISMHMSIIKSMPISTHGAASHD